MKETLRRRIAVTSFFNEISTNQLEKQGWWEGGRRCSAPPPPLSTAGFRTDIQRRRKRFSSTSDISLLLDCGLWKQTVHCTILSSNSWTKSRQKSSEFSFLLFPVTCTALPWDFYFFEFAQPLTVSLKEKGGKTDIKPYPFPYGLRNLKSENSQDYAQKPESSFTFINSASVSAGEHIAWPAKYVHKDTHSNKNSSCTSYVSYSIFRQYPVVGNIILHGVYNRVRDQVQLWEISVLKKHF
jgi:hypothetical protein